MASDGDRVQPAEDEMLPDEEAVLAERLDALDDVAEADLLTLDEVAAAVGLDRDTES